MSAISRCSFTQDLERRHHRRERRGGERESVLCSGQ
jgi:hypothetical protein